MGGKKIHGGYITPKIVESELDKIDRTAKEAMRNSQTPAQNAADEVFDSVEDEVEASDDRPEWEKLLDDIEKEDL
jgi:DNA invertase Pin-like site-specific DNA recombinase